MFLGVKTLIAIARRKKEKNPAEADALDKAIAAFGYAYDETQDTFYSTLNAWQRKMGYCRLYDESAAPTGMIVDCEPIYFEYNGKRWLIELWKGQYDLCTGCEIGVYTSELAALSLPMIYKNLFYHSANDDELLKMHVTLIKNGKVLLQREDVHWWLTAFKLAEFSSPSELAMNVLITLKDEVMRDAFVQALKNAGYKDNEIAVIENTVGFTFSKPHAQQPFTRTILTDWAIQVKNKYLCDTYSDISRPIDWLTSTAAVIMVQAPEIYKALKSLRRKN